MEIDGLTDLRTGGLTRLKRRTDKKRTLTNPGKIYRKFGKLKLRIFQEIQSVRQQIIAANVTNNLYIPPSLHGFQQLAQETLTS